MIGYKKSVCRARAELVKGSLLSHWQGGMGTFSSPRDEAGNSVRGQLATKFLSERLGLNLFASKPAAYEQSEKSQLIEYALQRSTITFDRCGRTLERIRLTLKRASAVTFCIWW